MTMAIPVQEFQIGQRVRPHGDGPFVIHYIRLVDGRNAYSVYGRPWYFASALTLAPARLPYVPSERRIVYRNGKNMRSAAALHDLYRCETDTELAARHAVERAEYDQQDATDAQGEHS